MDFSVEQLERFKLTAQKNGEAHIDIPDLPGSSGQAWKRRGHHSYGVLRMKGLVRGTEVTDTGDAIAVPVGPETLGRIFDVTGNVIDEGPKVKTKAKWGIHREAPTFAEQSTEAEQLVTGIKVVDLLCPYAKGGKIDDGIWCY